MAIIVGLLLLIIIALQFQGVQNFIAQKGANYLESTLNTRVDIGGFTTDWRNSLVLKDVYVEDQQQDTLWYSERLGVDIAIFSLLSGEVNISKVDLDNATLKLHIQEDSTTNFDFITQAFATDTTAATQPADTASSMAITLGTINLDNVYVVFQDEAGGNFIKTRVGELTTTMDELNLDEQRYMVDEVELANTWVRYEQTKLPPPDTAAPEPLEIDFGINRVALENIRVSYLSRPADQRIELALGESEMVSDNINLKEARVDLKSFMLHDTDVKYVQEKLKPVDSLAVNPARTAENLDKAVEETNSQAMNWVVTLGDLDVNNLDVAFDNADAAKQPNGMDFDHLLFSDIVLDAQDILYSLNRIRVDLNQLTLQEQSGFELNNFNANIVVDSTSASLTNLDLKTGNSHLQNDLALTYPSLDALTENPAQVGLDIDINDSFIGMRDVQYFAPDLTQNPSFRSISNSTIKLTAKADGQLDNVQVQNLQLTGLQGTNVDISGNIRNAMDPDNLYLDLDIDRFTTTRTDIQALTPAGTIPPDFQLPRQISMTGNYKGSLTAFDANADVRTSFGNVNAVVDMGADESFNATVRSGGFDLAQLFTDDSLGLGTVALTAKASGKGLTPETMQAKVQAQVQRFDYNNYTYNDIDLQANINRNVYDVTANAKDENLAFDMTGNFNLRDTQKPVYTFDLDLQGVDLQALNFYPEPLALQGQMVGNFTGADASTLSGTLKAADLVVRHNDVTYPIDTLALRLQQAGEMAELDLNSDIADAELHFENSLATLPTALQKHFSNYLDLQPDVPYPANTNLEDFTFSLQLKKTKLLASFVPGLTELQINDPITGSFDGQTKRLVVDGNVNSIVYTDYTLRNLALQIRGNKEQLGYNVDLQRLISPSLQMSNISLDGAARDNDLTVRLAVAGSDTTEQARFVVGGLLNSLGRGYRFAFNPDQLVINGDKWTVPQDNYLEFDTNLLYANNIRLQHNDMALGLNSTGPVVPNAPLNVTFDNFDIGYIMQTFQKQDSLIAGIVNGEATLNDIMSGSPAFTSDLNISDFAYEGTPVGDIALVASSEAGNRYNIKAQLTDNGNQMLINGFVETQPNATLLNLDANIGSLNLASLQGFTAGMVEDMDGRATGQFRITGTLDDPDIIGQLNFSQAQFRVTMLGSLYRLQDEQLDFNENGISFPNFTLTDSIGNELVVNGNVLTKDYLDYTFDLKVNADRFLALNSTAQDNDLFYGTLYVDAEASITGDMSEPVVNVDVSVLDGSNFTTVIPADEAGAAERDGIVEFVNLNESLTAIVGGEAEADSAQTAGFVGADIRAEIKVTDETPITIVIDPTTGDNLVVRGTADPLVIGVRPSGEINMNGRYTITSGKYSMDFYDLASRELDIAEGSYINWTGDPLQANMDITAIYTVETAPTELVASQTGGTADPALRNQVPFNVYVNVDGEILTPEISFDIRLPEDEQARVPTQVVASLEQLRQDDSELSKQVFALLVLQRFLAPDPLSSSGGGGFAASARNSLSQVMTDQLNQLTNKYAGGLGLELGVNSYEDYSSGSAQGRTDLNVALRQQFLNDRLTVRVGTDVGLEGGNQGNGQSNTMSGFGGDISVAYSLTEDGRLRIKGFQRNQYEGVLEGGDVRATGASLIFVRDYNNFSDLFRDLESRRAREAKRREEESQKLRTQNSNE